MPWLNHEIQVEDDPSRSRFILKVRDWVEDWRERNLIESFHFKHHLSRVVFRLRLRYERRKEAQLRGDLTKKISALKREMQLLEKSIPDKSDDAKNGESLDHFNDIDARFLEQNSELIFQLVEEYGENYLERVQARYLTQGKAPEVPFEMPHLLMNQLGFKGVGVTYQILVFPPQPLPLEAISEN